MKETLRKYARNVHSQFGEDGIIEKIFEVIGIRSKVCIEFGAWDGFYLSNTANLWTHGWRGVLIEADGDKFLDLEEKTKGFDCVRICARIAGEGDHTLEATLARHECLTDIDLLSIDVDGDDFYIFQSLARLRPRVVVCEYNPTIPVHLDVRQAPGGYFGCSALALVRLAQHKGYRLIAMTQCNCVFIVEEEAEHFQNYEQALEVLAPTDNLTYLITGYSGGYIASRPPTYGWVHPLGDQLIGDWAPFPMPVKEVVKELPPVIIEVPAPPSLCARVVQKLKSWLGM